jgi:hypothetical protein
MNIKGTIVLDGCEVELLWKWMTITIDQANDEFVSNNNVHDHWDNVHIVQMLNLTVDELLHCEMIPIHQLIPCDLFMRQDSGA